MKVVFWSLIYWICRFYQYIGTYIVVVNKTEIWFEFITQTVKSTIPSFFFFGNYWKDLSAVARKFKITSKSSST